jgi:hypothetical protein
MEWSRKLTGAMNNENKPLQEQYPEDESAPELLAWAKKAKARITRDIHENKKLQKQLAGQQIHAGRIRSQIKMYEIHLT